MELFLAAIRVSAPSRSQSEPGGACSGRTRHRGSAPLPRVAVIAMTVPGWIRPPAERRSRTRSSRPCNRGDPRRIARRALSSATHVPPPHQDAVGGSPGTGCGRCAAESPPRQRKGGGASTRVATETPLVRGCLCCPDARSRAPVTSSVERTTTSMSTIGFAANPGTDVLPMCSTASATPASDRRTRRAISSKRAGQASS